MIERALANPETRQQGIALAAATRDGRYRGTLEGFAQDAKAPEEVRVAAVEAIGSFRITPNRVLGATGRRRSGASRARIRWPRRRCGPWPSTPVRADD